MDWRTSELRFEKVSHRVQCVKMNKWNIAAVDNPFCQRDGLTCFFFSFIVWTGWVAMLIEFSMQLGCGWLDLSMACVRMWAAHKFIIRFWQLTLCWFLADFHGRMGGGGTRRTAALHSFGKFYTLSSKLDDKATRIGIFHCWLFRNAHK